MTVAFHDIQSAAKRVGKSERTIRNWLAAETPLPTLGGLIREDDLLEHERMMRSRVGRPKKAPVIVTLLEDVIEETQRQDAKWGQQNHADGTGPTTLPLYSSQRFLEDAMTAETLADILRARTDARAAAGTLTWKDILLEEVFEAMAEDDPVKLTEELTQVEAVAVQWRAAIDRRLAHA